MLKSLLQDALSVRLHKTVFSLHPACPPGLQQAVWGAYQAFRAAAAGAAPLHERRDAGLRVRIYRLGSYVVKEYTGHADKVASELTVLRLMQHGSLVSYLFSAHQGSRTSIFMQWAGDSLQDALAGQLPCAAEGVVQHIMAQLTSAVAHLHQQGILHRDIKPQNIAVQPDLTVKLLDFSEGLLLRELQALPDKQLARAAGIAGTPSFMPPEVLRFICGSAVASNKGGRSSGWRGWRGGGGGGGSNTSSGHRGSVRELTTGALDVWGLGTVLFFLLAGRDVFPAGCGYDLADMAEVAGGGVQLPPSAFATASAGARDFLHRCLHPDPAQRATPAQLLAHPWLAGHQAVAAAAAAAVEQPCSAGALGVVAAAGSGFHAAALRKVAGGAVPLSQPVSPHGSAASYKIRTAVYDLAASDSMPDTPTSVGTSTTTAATTE